MTDRTPHSLSDGRRFALVSDEHTEAFSFDWFEPSHWGDQAKPVSLGGRGAAWFIDSPWGRWVLRHYYRGGLPGRFVRKTYVFLGHSRVRSVREYQLLRIMHERGLPVPEPIAALYQTKGLTYTAAVIVRRIDNVRALGDFRRSDDVGIWRAAGACIRRFHDQGVFHADLNCTNILIDEHSHAAYLIDFDRGRLHNDVDPGASWMQANLDRLARSVRKNLVDIPATVRDRLFEALVDGYRAPDSSKP